MKKHISISLFLLIANLVGSAQQYGVGQLNSAWTNYWYQSSDITYTQEFNINEDTIINGMNYRKYPSIGAIRNDNGKVFFYPYQDLNQSILGEQDYLVMDFNAGNNDTILNVLFWSNNGGDYQLDTAFVDTVSFIQIGNYQNAKRVKLKNPLSTVPISTWTEIIGSNFDLIFSFSEYSAVDGRGIACVSIEDTVRYPYDNAYDSCAILPLSNSMDENSINFLRLYPNPASDQLQLKANKPIAEIELYSVSGILILRRSNDQKTINISNIPNGYYNARVEFTDGSTLIQKVAIQR